VGPSHYRWRPQARNLLSAAKVGTSDITLCDLYDLTRKKLFNEERGGDSSVYHGKRKDSVRCTSEGRSQQGRECKKSDAAGRLGADMAT